MNKTKKNNKRNKSEIRAFLAIEIDNNLLPKIKNIQDEFKKNTNINYVAIQNIHFTLKFFGNIKEDMIKSLKASIKSVLENYGTININIEKIGVFPNSHKVKVIWLGVKPNQELLNLQKDLDTKFKTLGFKKEKNYISHLTMGRVKNLKNKKEIKAKLMEFENIEIGEMEINSLSLKKSELISNGPIYSDLEVFYL